MSEHLKLLLAQPWECEIDPDDDPDSSYDLTIGGAPVVTFFGADCFPCLDEDDEDEMVRFREDREILRRLLIAVPDMVAALEKLSCLGNGELPGNSIGNQIAQAALAKATA